MKTTDSVMREKLGEIREQLKDRITEAYFIFSKKDKPEFKTLEEGEAWTRQHNYIAEQMIGSSLDNIMTMLSHSLAEARREWVEEIKKRISQCKQAPGMSCEYCSALNDAIKLTGDNPEREEK